MSAADRAPCCAGSRAPVLRAISGSTCPKPQSTWLGSSTTSAVTSLWRIARTIRPQGISTSSSSTKCCAAFANRCAPSSAMRGPCTPVACSSCLCALPRAAAPRYSDVSNGRTRSSMRFVCSIAAGMSPGPVWLCAPGRVTIGRKRMPHSSALVSVILPTFNRLRYLRPTVESLYAQTFPDWELIVADDGSESETREYLQCLAKRPRVTVVWLAHSGRPSMVRNAALRRAAGEYVAFLDSDDLWAPRKLERQIETLHARADCRWTYTGFLRVDQCGNPLPEEKTRHWMPYEGDIFDHVVTCRASIRTPSVLAA